MPLAGVVRWLAAMWVERIKHASPEEQLSSAERSPAPHTIIFKMNLKTAEKTGWAWGQGLLLLLSTELAYEMVDSGGQEQLAGLLQEGLYTA